MGFWPFGGGKRQRVVESDEHGRETLLRRTPSNSAQHQEKYGGEAGGLGRVGSKNGRDDSTTRRLSKQRPQNSKVGPYAQSSRSQTTPVRPLDDTRRTSRTNSQYDEKGLYQQNPMSQSSIQPENFTVVQSPPTLHARRTETDLHLPRRKSSKRKAEDFAREREIRAMSSSPIPIPKRPATLYGTGPLQRDSRQVPGPLNRRLERPTSEISLPIAGSLPDITNFSNQHSFKIGMLAALSPRPTVRYDANPKIASGKQPSRPNMAIRQAIVEEDVSDKKRIDELADDLDAGGLRELMERDRRRRERKKEADKAKLQRKLQRRVERQREEEARRARTEAFVQSSPAEGLQEQGLGIGSPSQTQDALSRSRATEVYENNDDPFQDPGPSTVVPYEPIRNPFDDEKDMDVMQDEQESDTEADVTGAVPVPGRSPLRHVEKGDTGPREQPSQSTLSPPVSPVHRAADRSSLSQSSFLNREVTPDVPESSSIERRISQGSSQRLSSWTTFFRRGSRRKFTGPSQGRATPSEFSNTSRESVRGKQPPVMASRTFRRSDSATPQRTMSRFREDLPELPISPPDSRVQSPEANPPPAINTSDSEQAREAVPSASNISSARDSTGLQISEQIDQPKPKQSVDMDVPLSANVGMVLSQSLASVDSEGSWLSGKPPKRLSGQLSHALKPSQSSLQRQMPGAFDQGDDDDDGMRDSQSTQPSSTAQGRQQQDQSLSASRMEDDKANKTARGETENKEPSTIRSMPSSGEANDEKWHSGMARQPTVVRQAGRAKSKEGLLKEFVEGEPGESSDEAGVGDDDQDSDSPDPAPAETTIMRARSVEYKGHIRHISAGSAKLLDIRRSSVHSDQSRPATSAARKSDLALNVQSPPPDSPNR